MLLVSNGMDLLKNFLKRFEHIRDPKEDKRKVTAIVSELLGAPIPLSSIEIKGPTLVISNIPSVLKSNLFLSKEKIVKALADEMPHLRIQDIR